MLAFSFSSPVGLAALLLLSTLATSSPFPKPTASASLSPSSSSSSPFSPFNLNNLVLFRRQDGVNPDFDYPDVVSCGKCQPRYASLDACVKTAPIFKGVSNVLTDPIGFVNLVKCACTESFSTAFTQCLNCFERTDQAYFITTKSNVTDAGSFVTELRQVCGLTAAILGGVAEKNGEVFTPSSSMAAPSAGETSSDDDAFTTPAFTDFPTSEYAAPSSTEAPKNWQTATTTATETVTAAASSGASSSPASSTSGAFSQLNVGTMLRLSTWGAIGWMVWL